MLNLMGHRGPETQRAGVSPPALHSMSKLSNSNTAGNVSALRLQCLRGIGITKKRADLVSSLAWGEPR